MKEPIAKIFSVSEFTEFISIYLTQVGSTVIEGEISEFKISQGKWLFLTLKDTDASVQVFAPVYSIHNIRSLEEGMKVHVTGIPRLYQKKGSFSISASAIEPVGEGALRIAFEKLKTALEKEGLFAPERKRPIPEFPENIGLITADKSEAYGDFTKVIAHRMGGLSIHFYPVSVQGADAVTSICRAFSYFTTHSLNLDAIVVIRGGGSLEDLAAFNDERVARAIFASATPVISGVGHEYDISIADLVADVRASTPSNAAELLVRNRQELLQEVESYVVRISHVISHLVQERKSAIDRSISILYQAITRQYQESIALIDRFLSTASVFGQQIRSEVRSVGQLGLRLKLSSSQWMKSERVSVDALYRILSGYNYHTILKRGFSITKDGTGRVITSIKSIKNDQTITTFVTDGSFNSNVQTIKEDTL